MSDHASLKRLLILDDDADFRKLLQLYLRKIFEGVEIVEYDPVARGVPGEDFDWSIYDVLILDYYLCIHNVTGLDILQANRKNRLFPATIMLTGAGNEEIAVRALKAGVYDYLRKEHLDKEQLRKSILDAFEKHRVEQQRLSELTNQSHAFNKALFYQELEQGFEDDPNRNRVLLLVQLDDHEDLEEKFGIIMRDNIVRHIAKQSFDIFQTGGCNPHITRLSDDCVALIIDDPGSLKTLEFNITGLCMHLKKHPYKFDEKKIRFTVSVGVAPIRHEGRTADLLINRTREASAIAGQQAGNSFHILAAAEEPRLATAAAPEPAEVAAEARAEIPVAIEAPEPGVTVELPHTPAPGEISVFVEPPVDEGVAAEKPTAVPAATSEPGEVSAPELILTLEPETTLESERVPAPELTVTLEPEPPTALPHLAVVEPALILETAEPAGAPEIPAAPLPSLIEPERRAAMPTMEVLPPEPASAPGVTVTVEEITRPAAVTPEPVVPEQKAAPPEPAPLPAPVELEPAQFNLRPRKAAPTPAAAQPAPKAKLPQATVTAVPKTTAAVTPPAAPAAEKAAVSAHAPPRAAPEKTVPRRPLSPPPPATAQPKPVPKPPAPMERQPEAPRGKPAPPKTARAAPPPAAPVSKPTPPLAPPHRARETAPATASPAPPVKPAATPAAVSHAPPVKPAGAAPVSAAAAPAVPAPAAPKPAVKDDAELEDAQLDPVALKIKKAFDEKRVIQAFQPVIPLFNTEGTDEREVFKVRLQLIDRDGTLMQEDEIYAKAATPAFRKFIDRWLLRETIGRLVNNKLDDYFFVLRISDASLADPALFNWLRKLLAGLEQRHPGRSIALELTAGEYSGQEKKAAALMDYLHKSHGFHFVLAGSSDMNEARTLTDSKRFNLLRIDSTALAEPKAGAPAAARGESTFEKIKAAGTRVIVDNVEDSTTLTNVISAGADYAMGNFIGEPVSQLGDTTNVESFEIT